MLPMYHSVYQTEQEIHFWMFLDDQNVSGCLPMILILTLHSVAIYKSINVWTPNPAVIH